jgi:hypothetical protein
VLLVNWRPGPDTMLRADRARLHRLLDFHRYSLRGDMFMSRGEWLRMPDSEYWIACMKCSFSPRRIQECFEPPAWMLALIPKANEFHGARP